MEIISENVSHKKKEKKRSLHTFRQHLETHYKLFEILKVFELNLNNH